MAILRANRAREESRLRRRPAVCSTPSSAGADDARLVPATVCLD
jgi:hypothetical protein